MKRPRPPRKAPPERLKLEVYTRQNGRCAKTGVRLPSIYHCEFQHDPPLGVRPVNDAGVDYVPPQHDPDYLFAFHPDAHKVATHGERFEKRHLLARDSDRGRIDKAKRLEEAWDEHAGRMSAKTPGQKRARKSTIPSRPFPPRSRPR